MTKQKILRACQQQWWWGGSWKSQFYQKWTSLIRRKAMNSTKSLYRFLLWEFLFNAHRSTAMGTMALDTTTHFHQASESAPKHYCTSSLIAEARLTPLPASSGRNKTHRSLYVIVKCSLYAGGAQWRKTQRMPLSLYQLCGCCIISFLDSCHCC